ncbi:GGDEF domain-containing protein [Rheinheimera sp.]|uniref:GGDEF domain-containing protein n=1 Tax=Rheinheimera sp. TaxID=1869214 RepID=UPI00307CE44F
MIERLKQDFYLMMVTLVGVLASFTLVPFVLYRLASGDYLVATVDLLLIGTCSLSVQWAWRTGDTERPGLMMAVAFCIGAVTVVYKLGSDALYWIYPLMMFLFFLVAPLKALWLLLSMLSAIALLYLSDQSHIFASSFQFVVFIATTLITCIFAYIFAYRTHLQRNELRKLATIDPLTGACNRHHLSDELTAAVQHYRTTGRDSGLMLLDLDHFKSINDQYGHQTGDQILMQLVPLLRQMVRQQDQIYRYGGEEFVILVQGIELADLHQLAEKVRHGIWQQLTLPDDKTITTSIGIACTSQARDWSHWLQLADQALYQAKHQGRNKVMQAEQNVTT